MIVGIASDHGGYTLKEQISEFLNRKDHTVKDFGAYSITSCDYPDYANLVCDAVEHNEVKYGILICGTGIGMSMVANRNPAIRDRVNAVNTQLKNGAGVSNITIHPKCKKLIQALERQIYKPGTNLPEKDTGFDHLVDSFGYGISYLKPIRKQYAQQEQPQQWGVKVA